MRSRIADFSGGITDFLFNSGDKYAEACNNFLITRDKKLLTRSGIGIYNTTTYQIPTGVKRISKIFYIKETPFTHSETHLFYVKNNLFSELVGPSSSVAFPLALTGNNISAAQLGDHYLVTNESFEPPIKIYDEGSLTFRLRYAGLPAPNTTPVVTPDTDDNKNYVYKFVFFYTYIINGTTYENFSSVQTVAVTDASDFTGDGNQITNLPTVTGTHYDTTNIKVKIYRTTHNGIVSYYVGEVTNGTLVYHDTMSDTTLLTNNILLYTEGGELEDDAPPTAKYVTVVDSTPFYANIRDGAENLGYRIMQGKPGLVDSVPAANYIDVDEDIIGFNSTGNFPIAFTNNKIYRIEGSFDSFGRGGLSARVIYDKSGCKGNNSIVRTDKGLYFAGNKGWYFTDGYQVQLMSLHLPDTFSTLLQNVTAKSNMLGAYDSENNRVYWTCQKSSECDTIFILDENHIDEQQGCFTTIDSVNNIFPSAIAIKDGTLIIGDSRGYLLRQSDSFINDVTINTATTPSNWVEQPVIYNWKHIPYDFNEPMWNKWVNKVSVFAKNESDLNLQVNSYDNLNGTPKVLKEITYKNDLVWDDPDWVWEDANTIWDEQETIVSTRWMVAGQLRTKFKQLQVTNATCFVTYSGISSLATIDTTVGNNTATIATYHWDTLIVGMQFRYELTAGGGVYSPYYTITQRVSDSVIKFAGPDSGLNLVGRKWEIYGIPRDQRLHLLALEYAYEVLSDKGNYYTAGQEGGNT